MGVFVKFIFILIFNKSYKNNFSKLIALVNIKFDLNILFIYSNLFFIMGNEKYIKFFFYI